MNQSTRVLQAENKCTNLIFTRMGVFENEILRNPKCNTKVF